MSYNDDNLYADQAASQPFRFDEKVVAVFPDMIKRSVPGYSEIIQSIQQLGSYYIKPNSNCYDLGCSLGAASLAMSYGNQQENVEIIGIDNSAAMINRCKNNIEGYKHQTPIQLLEANIQDITIENASMVVLNYTLQFVDRALRASILKNIFKGLLNGGILILSEKIKFDDPTTDRLMIDLHHQFKRDNGYSELEISRKRSALENVLLPETMPEHLSRLSGVGFKTVNCFHQHLNFASFIAIKS